MAFSCHTWVKANQRLPLQKCLARERFSLAGRWPVLRRGRGRLCLRRFAAHSDPAVGSSAGPICWTSASHDGQKAMHARSLDMDCAKTKSQEVCNSSHRAFWKDPRSQRRPNAKVWQIRWKPVARPWAGRLESSGCSAVTEQALRTRRPEGALSN